MNRCKSPRQRQTAIYHVLNVSFLVSHFMSTTTFAWANRGFVDVEHVFDHPKVILTISLMRFAMVISIHNSPPKVSSHRLNIGNSSRDADSPCEELPFFCAPLVHDLDRPKQDRHEGKRITVVASSTASPRQARAANQTPRRFHQHGWPAYSPSQRPPPDCCAGKFLSPSAALKNPSFSLEKGIRCMRACCKHSPGGAHPKASSNQVRGENALAAGHCII